MSDNPVVSFLNRIKMPLAIFVGISATAALKYKKIHVPEGTENPSAYKTSVVTFSVLKLTVCLKLSLCHSNLPLNDSIYLNFKAKIASNLNLGSEATIFRNILNYLLSKTVLSPKNEKALRSKFDQVEVSIHHS